MHRAPCPALLAASALAFAATVLPVRSQLTNAPEPDPLSRLMVSQPSIEIVTNPAAFASFDPPVVRVGELSTYRVTFNALDDSIQWPERIVAPPELEVRLSARGHVLLFAGDRLKPHANINHHVRAASVGTFTIEPFPVEVYGRRVIVPAARLTVAPSSAAVPPPGRRLKVEMANTNAFVGQAVGVRVVLEVFPANLPQRLAQVRFNGDGFLADYTKAQQSLSVLPRDGQAVASTTYETTLTPLEAGEIRFSAQGFASGSLVSGPILIPGQPAPAGVVGSDVLLDSDVITLNARTLPRAGALPGFTGAIGTFTSLPPLLSTNHVRVGDEINLTVVFSGKGNLARLVPPPPPVAPDWQVSSPAPGSPPRVVTLVSPTGTVVRTVAPPSLPGTFTYALRPLTARTTATPAIPFSFFDPERAVYVDLTIPSVPVTVVPDANTAGENLWAAAGSPSGETEKKLALSALATSPGRIVNSLEPLQQRRGFVLVQLLPLLAFVGLWSWDRRRRYLEQHPDVILRQRARRALRREKRALQKAWHAGDAVGIANIAVRAMRVACAPHYPAEPRALVCRDVLEVLGAGGGNGDVVRQFFAVTDASDFSATATDARALLALRAELDRVLQELEARL